MKKPGKYLKFYLRCVESGVMPKAGLCECLGGKVVLFAPDYCECLFADHDIFYWGRERSESGKNFNDFRQNVVLFCAAMNNEL